MKSAIAKYLFYVSNILVLIYIIIRLQNLDTKMDNLLKESTLNNSKMDYLDSDINKRNDQ